VLEVVYALAAGIGPLLGGTLAEFVSWRWIWWINLPMSGLTFLILLFCLDAHNPRTRLREGVEAVDWLGSLTIIGLVLMLLLGLNFGGAEAPWNSPRVVCLIVFGLLMSVLFYFSEVRLARYPLMPFSIFRQRSNLACFVVCFAHGFVSLSL